MCWADKINPSKRASPAVCPQLMFSPTPYMNLKGDSDNITLSLHAELKNSKMVTSCTYYRNSWPKPLNEQLQTHLGGQSFSNQYLRDHMLSRSLSFCIPHNDAIGLNFHVETIYIPYFRNEECSASLPDMVQLHPAFIVSAKVQTPST